MPKILIVDPLTLLGREVLHLLPPDVALSGPMSFRHTDDDDEHQVADIAGEPILVPPLGDTAELADGDAILVASDTTTRRGEMVAEFVENHGTTPVVSVGRNSLLDDLTIPATDPATQWNNLHVRVADPALVMLATILDCLRDMNPERATVAAVEPVSVRGQEEVERLARQAAKRLQGADVDELIGDHVRAFNAIAADADNLNRDAALLLPEISVAATRNLSGCFHGHAAHLGFAFARPVSENEVFGALRDDERLADPDLPVALDAGTGTDLIALSVPRFSRDGRTLAITAMADGLRVGGAFTALQILRSML